MSRGSFSRSVARAAASGGGRAYRSRPPVGWYAIMALIILLGTALVFLSRYQNLHPAVKATEGPTKTDVWNAALGVDICGKMQPNLPPSANRATVGIRTFGDGLINVEPGAATTPSNYTGAKATLGLFASNQTGMTLTATSIQVPSTGQTVYKNGNKCGSRPGYLETMVWNSPTGAGSLLGTDPTKLHLENAQMITLAFVPRGTTIPVPRSKSTLVSTLASSSTTTSTSTTSTSSTSTTTSTTTAPTSTTSKSTSTT